jgi:antitoxin component of MazEF toxin-antitoxin module
MYSERSYLKKNTPIRLKPTAKPGQRKYQLDELVRRITKKNRHGAVDWGRQMGKETW